MLIATLVAALESFDLAKQELFADEESFMNYLKEQEPEITGADVERLTSQLAGFDQSIENELKELLGEWQDKDFSQDQIDELTAIYHETQDRSKAAVAALVAKYAPLFADE